jgi:hypothetical protein
MQAKGCCGESFAISICYIFSSILRNNYAVGLPLFFLNLDIYGVHGVALHLMYLRRTIGHLPQQIF